MSDMMCVKEAARLWNLTERRVSGLCQEGKIKGARKAGRAWMIPADAEKPADHRVKTGLYKKNDRPERLPLPIGISDYRLASSEYYYVDKTMMIKDFLDERPMVSLFTRPRRFGKTLNMDMLRTFFEKTDEDTSVYFKDRKIWACGENYRRFQGKYPVIFLTFKDVKKDTWDKAFEHIVSLITSEYRRHSVLAGSERISDKGYYAQVIEGTVNRDLFDTSLYMLSKMLHEHYGIAPIIIIDEYDTPIQQGHMRGYYDEVVRFMSNLFSGCLKDNRHLSYGFLTGILRVAKESIFSGLNNLVINSVLDNRYSGYFGFTADEVKAMAAYYDADEKYDEICAWYDGYIFGETEIFNPWSVLNYFSNGCNPGAYWQATGSNDIIGEVMAEADAEIYDNLTSLVKGASFLTYIDTSVIYPQIKKNPASVYSFLLVAGYLKALKRNLMFSGEYIYEVTLPNREISLVYNKEILQRLGGMIPQPTAFSIQEAIFTGNGSKLQTLIQRLLMQSVSYYDAAGESFYHGFMLGLCALLGGMYVTSNRESGSGRYDLQLMPQQKTLPGILIELKAAHQCDEEELERLADAALQQIHEKQYDTEMKAKEVGTIYKYGVAFSGKNVKIASETDSL